MNTTAKARWIAALRSDKYAQGRGGFLKFGNSYCCLGVLCEIEDEPIRANEQAMPRDNFLTRVGLNPLQAMHYAGQNDDGVSFADIADEIEAKC